MENKPDCFVKWSKASERQLNVSVIPLNIDQHLSKVRKKHFILYSFVKKDKFAAVIEKISFVTELQHHGSQMMSTLKKQNKIENAQKNIQKTEA